MIAWLGVILMKWIAGGFVTALLVGLVLRKTGVMG